MSRTRQLGVLALVCLGTVVRSPAGQEKCPHIQIRGVYGGIPDELLQPGKTLADCGINAVWIGSGGLTAERVALVRQQGARVFAEFNTLHVGGY